MAARCSGGHLVLPGAAAISTTFSDSGCSPRFDLLIGGHVAFWAVFLRSRSPFGRSPYGSRSPFGWPPNGRAFRMVFPAITPSFGLPAKASLSGGLPAVASLSGGSPSDRVAFGRVPQRSRRFSGGLPAVAIDAAARAKLRRRCSSGSVRHVPAGRRRSPLADLGTRPTVTATQPSIPTTGSTGAAAQRTDPGPPRALSPDKPRHFASSAAECPRFPDFSAPTTLTHPPGSGPPHTSEPVHLRARPARRGRRHAAVQASANRHRLQGSPPASGNRHRLQATAAGFRQSPPASGNRHRRAARSSPHPETT